MKRKLSEREVVEENETNILFLCISRSLTVSQMVNPDTGD